YAFFEHVAECFSFNELHHDEWLTLLRLTIVVNCSDIWMAEGRDRSCFANETGAVVTVWGGQKLNRNPASKMLVFGEVDDSHAAFAQFFDNSVMGNCLTDHAQRKTPSLRKEESWKQRGSWEREHSELGFTLEAFCCKERANSRKTGQWSVVSS